MSTILVTGCNRGIGLELVRQLQERGDTLIAVCREASAGLEASGARIIEGIDVADGEAVQQLREAIGDEPIDVLINNAGILRRDAFGSLDYEEMLEQYRVNTLGPLRVTEALAGNLREGSKVAIVTSRVGSPLPCCTRGSWRPI
mgnify:FL=1